MQNSKPIHDDSLELFFDSSVDLFCIAGFDGYFHKVNQAFVETLGYSREVFLRKPFLDFIHPDDHAKTITELERLRRGELTLSFEIRFLCEDGKICNVSWSCKSEAGKIYAVGRDVTQNLQVQSSLQESRNTLDYILQVAPVVLFRIDTDGIIQFSSGSALKAIGMKDHENVGRSVYELHEKDSVIIENFERALGGEEVSFQVSLTQNCIFENKYSPLRDENLKIIGIIGIAIDVTDVVNAQQDSARLQSLITYQNAERKFRETIENVNVGISHVTQEGRYVLANKELCRILGRDESELLGHKSSEFIYADDLEEEAKILDGLNKGLFSHFEWEKRYVRKDQRLIWVMVEMSCVKDDYGKIKYFIAAEKDITRRKQVEEALRKNEENFRYLAEAIPQIIWTATPNGEIDYFNQRWYESTGMDEKKSLGWTWTEAIHPDDVNGCISLWTNAVKSGTIYEGEHRFKNRSTGEWRWHLGRGLPMKDESGRVLKWFGTATDIHDQKISTQEKARLLLSEKAAIESSRVKSEFLANMSHEIRTPLNGLIGTIDLLDGSVMDPEQKEYVKTVQKSSRILFDLLSDILDLSKIESGKLELENIRFDVNSVLEDIETSLKLVADTKHTRLKVARLPLETIVMGDRQRLRQILFNLVQNAIKFTQEGSVDLETHLIRNEDGTVLIRFHVMDTGIGISPAFQAKLFKPFSQADSSTTRKFGGTGLGLSICKHLLELMGGEFAVSSTRGLGSRFSFELKFKTAKRVRKKPRTTPKLLEQRPRKVLVAEDNETNRLLLERFLKKKGHEVVFAQTGSEAVIECRKNIFDLILMDCHMPEMDGFQASHFIRKDRGSYNQNVPIYALTADVVKGTREKCKQAEMTGYLSKPLDLEKLMSVMDRCPNRNNLLRMGVLEKLSELNEEGLPDVRCELVSTFLSNLDPRVEAIQIALDAADLTQVANCAHALKGAASTLGVAKIAVLCRKLETFANAKQVPETKQALSRLHLACRLTKPLLSAFLVNQKY